MITILLAAYNGERFITEQIESLLSQTVQDFKLYITDDKSTDATWEMLSDLAEKNPDKIAIYQNEINSGGAKYNFLKMMSEHSDDYVMLCDQDDVWLPDKIEKTIKKMCEMEKKYGAETPLLVYTDLKIVDENLKTISPSYKAAMNANFSKTSLRNLISQTTLAGCAAMYNRALSNMLTDTPSFIVMHDWWIMLVASAFGKIDHIDEQTVLYRQHGSNDVGAKDVRKLGFKLHKMLHNDEIKKALSETYTQAASFLEVYSDRLAEEQKALLTAYINIPNKRCKLARMIEICRLGSLKNGFSRKLAHLLYI